MKYKIIGLSVIACLGLIGFLTNCRTGTIETTQSHASLLLNDHPCNLVAVRKCIKQCEIVYANQYVAMDQELATGQSLSHFDRAVCKGQYETIYKCYLHNLGKEDACSTLDDIIATSNYKLTLENPNCQCTSVYS